MKDNRKEIADSAKGFVKAGYTIFPVEGKRPKQGLKWRQAPYILPSEVDDFFTEWNGNYGIAPNEQQLVIDVDPRNFTKGDAPHTRLFSDIGADPKNFTKMVQTGGGGLHLFLRLPDLPKGKRIRKNHKAYKGIDFISSGAYVVGAGSKHPETGECYKTILDLPVAEAPDELMKILLSDKKEKVDLPALIDSVADEQTVNRYREYLKNAEPAVEGDSGDKVTFIVACKGKEYGLSPEDTFLYMSEIYNPRCSPEWPLEELKVKVSNAYEYSENPLGSANPATDFAEIPAKQIAIHPEFRGWQTVANSNIKKPCVGNVDNYFINYHEEISPLHDSLAFNELTNSVVKIKHMPWDLKKAPIPRNGAQWLDIDTLGLMHFLSVEKKFNVGKTLLEDAIPTIARRNAFHPVRNYLNGLEWDGVNRLETWLIDNSGAVDTLTNRAFSKLLIMQAVARAYMPGCKADMVVILEGEQGIGKSSLVQLLGGEFYSDVYVDPDNKDTFLAMNGKWIIEMSEMVAFRRKEYESLKRFISNAVDNYRVPYGRHSADVPRQSTFVSTVNPDATGQYLSDPTGNRRFGPIDLKKRMIDLSAIEKLRDQLFAEARHRVVVNGEKHWITDHQTLKMVKEEQARRTVIDSYMGLIEPYIQEKTPTGVTVTHIWVNALNGSKAAIKATEQKRISACLRELGYVYGNKRIRGRQTWMFTNPDFKRADSKENVWLT